MCLFGKEDHAEHDGMLRFDVAQSTTAENGRKEAKSEKIKTCNFENFNINSY